MSEKNIARRPPAQPVVQPPGTSNTIAAFQDNKMLVRMHAARMFPRDIEAFRERLLAEVSSAPEGLVYWKPQKGAGNWKPVVDRRTGAVENKEHLLGFSVRMAEIAARLFTNIHLGEPKIEEHDGRVTVTVEALDLESNVSTCGVSTTSLVGSNKQRYFADVVSNLVSATASKARRQAIAAIIGQATLASLVPVCLAAEERAIAAAQATERGAGNAGATWRKHVAAWERAHKITEAELLAFLGAATSEEVTAKMMVQLNAAAQSVREGVPARVALGLDTAEAGPPESDVESIFADEQDDGDI